MCGPIVGGLFPGALVVDRTALEHRLMMNTKLVAHGQARLIIPTVFRNNYLLALKSLSHNQNAQPLIRVLDFAQHYTSLIDWSIFENGEQMLTKTHAFADPHEADLMGVQLILP